MLVNGYNHRWLLATFSALAALVGVATAAGFWEWVVRWNPRCVTCRHRQISHDRTVGCLVPDDCSNTMFCHCKKFLEVPPVALDLPPTNQQLNAAYASAMATLGVYASAYSGVNQTGTKTGVK